MASLLNRLNPTPGFPSYAGPYSVGSIDVELPAAELQNETADFTPSPTIAFRCFYPCDEPAKDAGPVYWVQKPQRGTISAYARFLGAGSAFADLLSYFPQILYHIKLPVHRNAPLLPPPDTTRTRRWPVVVFSHGLGGSRNSYSHFCGSLASYGLVVLAPEHRDGSCPISYIRATSKTEARTVDYRRFSHTPSPEVYAGRDEQLQTRLWELSLVHKALEKMDAGEQLNNLDSKADSKDRNSPSQVLANFKDRLSIGRPGAITWAGHSFGACTTVQFVKSLFYHPESPHETLQRSGSSIKASSLLRFTPSASLLGQISSQTPTALLDLWTLPLNSPSTSSLKALPMPFFSQPASQKHENAASPIIAILSSAFVNWASNFRGVRGILARPATSTAKDLPPAEIFYPISSAHLSQSDFGILFPRMTKYLAKAPEPERTLELNVRAVLQVLRNSGIKVAGDADPEILSRAEGVVRGWVAVAADGQESLQHEVNMVTDEKQGFETAYARETEVLGSGELEGVKAEA